MKNKILSLISLLLTVCVLFGCSRVEPNDLMGGAEQDLLNDFGNYDASADIPSDVVAALDYMVENYTNGIRKIDEDDVEVDEITDDEEKDDLEEKSFEAKTREDVVRKMVDALGKTEKGVTLKIPSSMYNSNFILDIYENEIDGVYIIESMGLNAFVTGYYRDLLTNSYVVDVEFVYMNFDGFKNGCTLAELREMKRQAKQKAEELVKELKLEALSEYEAVKAVNSYLCETITYSEGNSPYEPVQHTVYGALINGDCVCEGYAKAAQLLFQMCGIESYYVVGDTSGGPHGWNLVKVDGEYYQLDVTWNDADLYKNKYFLVTDEYMRLSRRWDESRYPASAKEPYKN